MVYQCSKCLLAFGWSLCQKNLVVNLSPHLLSSLLSHISHSLSLSHMSSVSLFLSHTHTFPLSLSHSLCLCLSLSNTFLLYLSHIPSASVCLSVCLSLAFFPPLSLSLSSQNLDLEVLFFAEFYVTHGGQSHPQLSPLTSAARAKLNFQLYF